MNAFAHRRPLAAYIREHNPDLELPSSLWFTRARWFAAGVVFAAAFFAIWST